MDEQQIEEKLAAIQSRHADKVRAMVDEVLSESYVEILPYMVADTVMNAQTQAEEIVTNIASGDFERDGDHVTVRHPRDFNSRVRIKMSDHQYDSLRDNLIASMPECPKDAKIRALEKQLRIAHEWR